MTVTGSGSVSRCALPKSLNYQGHEGSRGVFVAPSTFELDAEAEVVYFTDRFPQAEDVTYLELPQQFDPR
jgi:hypothetical protein